MRDTESERWSFEVTEMGLSGLHVTPVTESAQSRPAGEDAGRASEDSAAAGNLGSERAMPAGEASPLLTGRMRQEDGPEAAVPRTR